MVVSFAGGAIIATGCEINISQSTFENNGAEYCGAILAQQHSIIIINNNIFINSYANHGGVLYSLESNLIIERSKFDSNTATSRSNFSEDGGLGGVMYSLESNITIQRSTKFDGNTATSLTSTPSLGGKGTWSTVFFGEQYHNTKW